MHDRNAGFNTIFVGGCAYFYGVCPRFFKNMLTSVWVDHELVRIYVKNVIQNHLHKVFGGAIHATLPSLHIGDR